VSCGRQIPQRVDRLALPANLEVQLDLVGVGVAHLGDLLSLDDLLPLFDQDVAVVRVRRQVSVVVLDDDELAVPAKSAARVDDLSAALAVTGCPADPAMSMPLRLVASENPETILPFAAIPNRACRCRPQRRSQTLRLAWARTRRRLGGRRTRRLRNRRRRNSGGDADAGATLAAAPAARWTSRSACSEYGSLSAFGCVLYVSALRVPGPATVRMQRGDSRRRIARLDRRRGAQRHRLYARRIRRRRFARRRDAQHLANRNPVRILEVVPRSELAIVDAELRRDRAQRIAALDV
jgi:hypothetical protein